MECQSAAQLRSEPKHHQGRGAAPSRRAHGGRRTTCQRPPSRWAHCLATDFEQVLGAAQGSRTTGLRAPQIRESLEPPNEKYLKISGFMPYARKKLDLATN